MIVLCHPRNYEAVQKVLRDRYAVSRRDRAPDGATVLGLPLHGLPFEVRTSEYLDVDRPTGRYVLPGGKVVPANQVKLRTRFVTYGPEDIHWLLFSGVIREEREMVVYALEEADVSLNIAYEHPTLGPVAGPQNVRTVAQVCRSLVESIFNR